MNIKYKEPKTIRRNGRWVKLTHQARGKWYVAQGFEGQITAAYGRSAVSETHARVIAYGWLDDNG